jgi:hypothetical protein
MHSLVDKKPAIPEQGIKFIKYFCAAGQLMRM